MKFSLENIANVPVSVSSQFFFFSLYIYYFLCISFIEANLGIAKNLFFGLTNGYVIAAIVS